MRAIQITQTGGPEVLRFAELPEPKPTTGQLLVAVVDRVVWATSIGSYAEQSLVPAEKAVPVPPGMALETRSKIWPARATG